MPALHASKKGRDVILAFEDDIGTAIHYANENSRDSQAILLSNSCSDNKKRKNKASMVASPSTAKKRLSQIRC